MGYDMWISSRLYEVTFDNEGSLLQGYLESNWKKSLNSMRDYVLSKVQVADLANFMREENKKSRKEIFAESKIEILDNMVKTMQKKEIVTFCFW